MHRRSSYEFDAATPPLNFGVRDRTERVSGKALVKLVVLDVDGTLLDNLESEDVCFAAALREGLGVTTLNTDWRTYEHVTDKGIAVEAYQRAFSVPPSAKRVTQAVDRFLTLLAEAHARVPLRPVAGARDLLAELPTRGWFPALATGAWERAARFKLTAAGLRVDQLPLATAEDGPARIAIVRAALARAERKCSPFERVVLVGDGVWDVAAAQALGLPFVGRASLDRAQELRARGVGAVLSHFTDIEMVLAVLETAGPPLETYGNRCG